MQQAMRSCLRTICFIHFLLLIATAGTSLYVTAASQKSTLFCIIYCLYPLLTVIAFAGAPLFITAAGQKKKLDAADDAFLQSDTLKALLEKSAQNKAKNKKDIENK
jgi:hypothetical protein